MNKDYENPNKYWYYKQRFDYNSVGSMKGCFYSLLGIILITLFSLLFSGCQTIRYVPVETVKTEYIHSTDTVNKIDSVFSEKETIIREADSALVAKLGLQLKANEKAILILKRELEKQVSKESEHKTDTIIKTDSIQVPYPVEKSLTKWQQTKMDIGGGAIIALGIILALLIVGWILKMKKVF